MLSSKLHSSIGNTDKLYVDDVFSAYTYSGNSSTQTINNGIDLAQYGGLVWEKTRTSTADHFLWDSARGTNHLNTNNTDAQANDTIYAPAFNSTGYTSNYGWSSIHNTVSWTFCRAPKFFDVVTYTGNGTTNNISHGLGVFPGFLIIKCTSHATNWAVIARVNTTDYALFSSGSNGLNSTGAGTVIAMGAGMNSSTFNASWMQDAGGSTNESGRTYVAYLFAHDPSADGIIQCGSFTTDGSSKATVNLGWEPQYVLVKKSADTGDWFVFDSMRGMANWLGGGPYLSPNLAAAEVADGVCQAQSMGFMLHGSYIPGSNPSQPFIYLAIRRPNKPPTTGTKVYNAVARTGTNSAATVSGVGFAPDYVQSRVREGSMGGGGSFATFSRLIGPGSYLNTALTSAAISDAGGVTAFTMDGITVGGSGSVNNGGVPNQYINHFFKRAPGFFDVVCYTGVGGASQVISHGLSAAPEMIILKKRNAAGHWPVYHSGVPTPLVNNPNLNENVRYYANEFIRSTPSAAQFTVYAFNDTGTTYVAYLFASLPGVSKVGSYTGNGSSQTINCGFSTGARFVLIKRTDSAGDWFVWDTARGIVSANDPHLSLNTTSAEVTTNDSVDPDGTGFIVNQVAATNINVTSATYIFLAVS